jgi:hypothetical protein
MTMSERDVFVEVRIRQGYGRQWRGELRVTDPDAIQGIIERAAGRGGGSGWAFVTQHLHLAIVQTLLEWAQKEHPAAVEAARSPADILACTLALLRRRERVDSEPDEG